MKKYRAVIFDLFGTLIHFNEKELPVFQFGERKIHGTLQALYDLTTRERNGFSFDRFFEAFSEVSSRHKNEKSLSLREISSVFRMKTVLVERLGFPDNRETDRLAGRMKTTHMRWLKKGILFPIEYRDLLAHLKRSYQLGLLSNFDDSETGHEILADLAIGPYFHSILFSEESGWIKPSRQLYLEILSRMGTLPGETLFVGDTPLADIIGAKGAGMDAVWINPDPKSVFPEKGAKPDFEITRLTELTGII